MNHQNGFAGVLAALLVIAIGAILFIISLGELLGIVFAAGSISLVWISSLRSSALFLLAGAFVGAVLVTTGIAYLLTHDLGIAGLMMGSTGFVGVFSALTRGATSYAAARRKGNPRQ